MKCAAVRTRRAGLVMRSLLVSVVVLAGVIAFIGPLEILKCGMYCLSADTEYAPGFSEQEFRKIRIGDSEESVRAALGAPLKEQIVAPYTSWLYTADPQPTFEATGQLPGGCSYTQISFDAEGRF